MGVQARTRMAASPGTLRSEREVHFLAAAFFLPFFGASSSTFLAFFAIARVGSDGGCGGAGARGVAAPRKRCVRQRALSPTRLEDFLRPSKF